MRLCSDPRLTYLNRQGYSVLRLPQQGIEPLCVIRQDKAGRQGMGKLPSIWDTKKEAPQAKAPRQAAEINGAWTKAHDLSMGLDLLKNALGGLIGGAAPDLSSHFKNARKFEFQFQNVEIIEIDFQDLDEYLDGGRPKANLTKYFDQGLEVEVITAVLQTTDLNVRAGAEGSSGVAAKAEEIKALLGAKLSVDTTKDDSDVLKFSGKTPVTFGFQSYRLFPVEGRWQLGSVKPSAKTAFADARQAGAPKRAAAFKGLLDVSWTAVKPASTRGTRPRNTRA